MPKTGRPRTLAALRDSACISQAAINQSVARTLTFWRISTECAMRAVRTMVIWMLAADGSRDHAYYPFPTHARTHAPYLRRYMTW